MIGLGDLISNWVHALIRIDPVAGVSQWQRVTSVLEDLKADLCPSQTADLFPAQVRERFRRRAIAR